MNDGYKETIYHKIDYLDIKSLDCIYNQEITVMKMIRERLKGIATRKTISKRIKKLADMKLFKVIENTNPLCIQMNMDDNVIKEFITKQKIKMELI